MHFQIYIPDTSKSDPALLEELGLADLREGAEFLPTAEGPGALARRGMIVAWRKPGKAQIGYQPEKQTWFPAVRRDGFEEGRYWVGIWNQDPITPRDLERNYQQSGKFMTLGDDQEWLIPAAKELDATLRLADDGTWKYEIQRRYHRFWIAYGRWFEFFGTAGPETEFQFSEAAEFVLQGLQINYRLTPELVSELGLFTKSNVLHAMFAILGVSQAPER